MKQLPIYLTIVIGLTFFDSQAKQRRSETDFIIEGSINKLAGEVSLIPIVELDSIRLSTQPKVEKITKQVVNGRFQFTGRINTPYGFYLKYCKDNRCLYTSTFFVIEKGIQLMRVDLAKANPFVSNRTMQSFYTTQFFRQIERWQKDVAWFNTYSDSLRHRYKNHSPDSLSKVIIGISRNLQEREATQTWSLCERLPTSYYAFWALYNRFITKGYQPEYSHLIGYFPDSIQKTNLGQQLAYQLNNANPLGVGKFFPTAQYKNLISNYLEPISTRSKYTLLEFWWSGCGICLQHIPALKKLHARCSPKGFSIIGISTDKTERITHLRALLNKYHFEWPEYLDENSVAADKIGILFYPTYILLDCSGVIINNNIRLTELETYLNQRLN